MRLSVVKQSFFGPPGQYGHLVARANLSSISTELKFLLGVCMFVNKLSITPKLKAARKKCLLCLK